MDTLQHDLPNLETQIPPIHEQFTILEKYEVPVQDSVSSSGAWPARARPVPVADCGGSGCLRSKSLGCRDGGHRSERGEGTGAQSL